MNRYRKKYLRQKGWSSGFHEHRYGEIFVGNGHVDPRSRITLAGVSLQSPKELVKRRQLNRVRKISAVERVVDLARKWRFNRWEAEGPIHYGMRAALCLEGWPWHSADEEAADVVRRAFNRLGRGKESRPSEDEADELSLVAIEDCLRCGGPLTEAQIAMRLRYCDIDCARSAYLRRSWSGGAYSSIYGRAAYQIIYREKFEERQCANPLCNRSPTFRPLNESQRFCTPACLYDSQKTPDRSCDYCGKMFAPTRGRSDQRYCTHEHALLAKRTVQAVRCARTGCDNHFVPKKNAGSKGGRQSLYCGAGCARAVRAETLHQLTCKCCSRSFEAGMPNARFCSETCRQIVKKIERGTPPARLSAQIFDFEFYRQKRLPIHDLFDAA